jgi:hypothetical protein
MAKHIHPATIAALMDDRAAAGLADDRLNLCDAFLCDDGITEPSSLLGLSGKACVAIASFAAVYFAIQLLRMVTL